MCQEMEQKTLGSRPQIPGFCHSGGGGVARQPVVYTYMSGFSVRLPKGGNLMGSAVQGGMGGSPSSPNACFAGKIGLGTRSLRTVIIYV